MESHNASAGGFGRRGAVGWAQGSILARADTMRADGRGKRV